MRLAILDEYGIALQCSETLGRALANTCGQPNPFGNGIKLRHQFDHAETMSTNDLVRELLFDLAQQLRRQEEADDDTAPMEQPDADVCRSGR